MDTPVLSKFQKKLSLTGRKSRKETIKHVVVDPYKSYWPLVQSELETLWKILKDNLPRVRPVKINVPWRLLKDIPKGERKIVRDTYIRKQSPAEQLMKQNNLIFGVNEVTKLLESDSCSIVLIADVKPRMVVKHIIEMAVLRSIPVLVISTLKEILKDFCGLESMAVAIKGVPSNSSSLASIVEIVVEISKNYPPNTNHINLTRSNIFQEEDGKKVSNVEESVEIKNEQQKPISYYLIRTSLDQVVFIPELNKNVTDVVISDAQKGVSFMTNGLYHDEGLQAIKKKKAKKLYKALVVKRLKRNNNRQKEKDK